MKTLKIIFLGPLLLLISCGGGPAKPVKIDGPEGTYKDSYQNFLGTTYYRVVNIYDLDCDEPGVLEELGWCLQGKTWNHSIYKEGETEISGIADYNGFNHSGSWEFKDKEFVEYGEVILKKVLVLYTDGQEYGEYFYENGCIKHIPLTSDQKRDKEVRESLGVVFNHPTDPIFCESCDSYSLCKS